MLFDNILPISVFLCRTFPLLSEEAISDEVTTHGSLGVSTSGVRLRLKRAEITSDSRRGYFKVTTRLLLVQKAKVFNKK